MKKFKVGQVWADRNNTRETIVKATDSGIETDVCKYDANGKHALVQSLDLVTLIKDVEEPHPEKSPAPEYGTLEYAKAHVGEWWKGEDERRYFLVGFHEDNEAVYIDEINDKLYKDDVFVWFSGANRPESDPAPKPVMTEEVWIAYERSSGHAREMHIEKPSEHPLFTVVHIPPQEIK